MARSDGCKCESGQNGEITPLLAYIAYIAYMILALYWQETVVVNLIWANLAKLGLFILHLPSPSFKRMALSDGKKWKMEMAVCVFGQFFEFSRYTRYTHYTFAFVI